jgi:hypothetical protein
MFRQQTGHRQPNRALLAWVELLVAQTGAAEVRLLRSSDMRPTIFYFGRIAFAAKRGTAYTTLRTRAESPLTYVSRLGSSIPSIRVGLGTWSGQACPRLAGAAATGRLCASRGESSG